MHMHSFVNKATGQDEAVIYITFQFSAGKLYDLQPISTDGFIFVPKHDSYTSCLIVQSPTLFVTVN